MSDQILLAEPQHSAGAGGQAERRRKPRVSERFGATVHGVAAGGGPFRVETVLENISAGGVYFLLPHEVECGCDLLVVGRFTKSQDDSPAGPLVAMFGRAVRVVPAPGGMCGVALQISEHHFL